jgi:hypothetical protein
MDILFLNHRGSLIGCSAESTFLRPYLIIADELNYVSMFSELILQYRWLDKMPDKFILESANVTHKDEPEVLEKIEFFLAHMNVLNKLKNLKHKTRYELDMWITYKRLISEFRSDYRKEQEEILNTFNLMEMFQFIDDNVWRLGLRKGYYVPGKEDSFIPVISKTLIESELMISLEYNVDVAYRNFFEEINAGEYAFDYIKIPLWQMPPMVSTPYEEVKHSRQQLQPVLKSFNDSLKEFRNEIHGLSFKEENKERISQKGMEMRSRFLQPVQHAIDNCLYLSKLKNLYADHMFLKFCLGITSAENIVDYYLANKIIEPYAASEVKKRIARESDLQSSHVFCYFEVHNDDNKEFTLAEMKNAY